MFNGGLFSKDSSFIHIDNFFLVKMNYRQVLSLGMHIGHTKKASCFYTGWMFFGLKNKVIIMHPVLSAFSLKSAFISITSDINSRRPIWFVNARTAFFSLVRNAALKCGESFVVTRYWLSGLLSNFKYVFSFLLLLRSYLLKGFFLPRKYKLFLSLLLGLKLARSRVPSTVFIISLSQSQRIANDTLYTRGTMGLYISDTDAKTRYSSGVIPSNDECLSLFFFFF